MAILRSMDGRFYQVPDEELAQHLVPPDKVLEAMRAAGYCVPAPGEQAAGESTAGMVMAYQHPPGPGGHGPGPHGPGPHGPHGPGHGPGAPWFLPFFTPPPPPPVYYNYRDYRNYWGGW